MNSLDHTSNGVMFVNTGADARGVAALSPLPETIMERGDLTEFEQHQLRLMLLAQVGMDMRKDGSQLPRLDYRNAEFLPPIAKSEGGEPLEKADRSGYKTQEYEVRLPRIVARFPFISKVSSKITAMKKKYRMKKLLNRTPRAPRPQGGPLIKQGTARPVQAKLPTSVGRFTVPKGPKLVIPKAPPLPKPVKSPSVKFKLPKPVKAPKMKTFHRSLAHLPGGVTVRPRTPSDLLSK